MEMQVVSAYFLLSPYLFIFKDEKEEKHHNINYLSSQNSKVSLVTQ